MKEEVSDAVKQRRTGQSITLKTHLGGGIYCTMNEGFDSVNFRQYFVPEGQQEAIPTKRGISLKFTEWEKFAALVDEMKQLSPDLLLAEPCYMNTNHYNQLGFLNCKECKPFPDKDLFSYLNF
jgi:Transcriptional Coactivator p15 (PC4)